MTTPPLAPGKIQISDLLSGTVDADGNITIDQVINSSVPLPQRPTWTSDMGRWLPPDATPSAPRDDVDNYIDSGNTGGSYTDEDEGVEAIQRLLDSIRGERVAVYRTELKSLPLDQVDQVTTDNLLVMLLNYISISYNQWEGEEDILTQTAKTMVSDTIDQWETKCDTKHHISSYLRLWVNPDLTSDTLSLLVASCPQNTPNNLFIDLINATDGDAESLEIAKAIENFYQPLTSFWVALAELLTLNNRGTDAIYSNHFIVAFIRLRNNNRPAWIHNKGNNNPVMEETYKKLLAGLPTPRAIAEMTPPPPMTEAMQEAFLLSAATNIAITTIAERICSIEHDETIRKQYEFDLEVFRAFGPVNSQHTCAGGDGCDRHLDCRMLVCCAYEGEDDSGSLSDWFIGYCQRCDRLVDSRRYAVREPLVRGGWHGCYCSWKCVEEDVDERTQADDNVVAAAKSNKLLPTEALLVHNMINRAREQLTRYGLHDIDDSEGTIHVPPAINTTTPWTWSTTPDPLASAELPPTVSTRVTDWSDMMSVLDATPVPIIASGTPTNWTEWITRAMCAVAKNS